MRELRSLRVMCTKKYTNNTILLWEGLGMRGHACTYLQQGWTRAASTQASRWEILRETELLWSKEAPSPLHRRNTRPEWRLLPFPWKVACIHPNREKYPPTYRVCPAWERDALCTSSLTTPYNVTTAMPAYMWPALDKPPICRKDWIYVTWVQSSIVILELRSRALLIASII